MRISAVVTSIRDLTEAKDFYAGTLGFEVRDLPSADGIEVIIGFSRLRLIHRPDVPVADHLAFQISPRAFPAAKRWLQARTDLLTRDGEDEVEGPEGWNSRSLYFQGPSGSVLELIARRRLEDTKSADDFDAMQVAGISEVGIASENVSAAVGEVSKSGLEPFGGFRSADFCPVGDDDGLLIFASEGRAWAPTQDIHALSQPISVSLVEVPGSARKELSIGQARLSLAPA